MDIVDSNRTNFEVIYNPYSYGKQEAKDSKSNSDN